MMWLTLLRKFWPYLVGAAVIAGAFFWYQSQISAAREAGYKAATDAMEAELQKANAATLAAEEASRKRVNEVERENQQLLSQISDRYRASPLPAVRLCNDSPRRSEVPSNPGTAAVDPGPAEGDRFPGRDIGPGLTRIARDADEQTARLIACQNYVRALF